jgi:hypothetical protein
MLDLEEYIDHRKLAIYGAMIAAQFMEYRRCYPGKGVSDKLMLGFIEDAEAIANLHESLCEESEGKPA